MKRRGEAAIVDRFVSREIGPAMPETFLHAPEQIRRAPYRSAAAFVVAVVGDVKLAVGAKCEPEWIAKSPRDEFEI